MNEIHDAIAEIIRNFPQERWLNEAKKAFPAYTDAEIISIIEIQSGGDVIEIKEHD